MTVTMLNLFHIIWLMLMTGSIVTLANIDKIFQANADSVAVLSKLEGTAKVRSQDLSLWEPVYQQYRFVDNQVFFTEPDSYASIQFLFGPELEVAPSTRIIISNQSNQKLSDGIIETLFNPTEPKVTEITLVSGRISTKKNKKIPEQENNQVRIKSGEIQVDLRSAEDRIDLQKAPSAAPVVNSVSNSLKPIIKKSLDDIALVQPEPIKPSMPYLKLKPGESTLPKIATAYENTTFWTKQSFRKRTLNSIKLDLINTTKSPSQEWRPGAILSKGNAQVSMLADRSRNNFALNIDSENISDLLRNSKRESSLSITIQPGWIKPNSLENEAKLGPKTTISVNSIENLKSGSYHLALSDFNPRNIGKNQWFQKNNKIRPQTAKKELFLSSSNSLKRLSSLMVGASDFYLQRKAGISGFGLIIVRKNQVICRYVDKNNKYLSREAAYLKKHLGADMAYVGMDRDMSLHHSIMWSCFEIF